MKVAVSCAGRFHAFHLVEQLYKRGMLSGFTTTTLNDTLIPNRELPESLKGNPDFLKLVYEIPLPEYLCYLLRKLPFDDAQSFAYFAKDNWYDQAAVKHVGRSDLFVGWADQSLFQLREAKARGAIGIIERGSSHITAQRELLEQERRTFGASEDPTRKFDNELESKQLKEYHEADYIMVPSEFARKSFTQRGFSEKKILKVPYGVDLSRFAPPASPRRLSGFKILFVGAVGFQKGVPYLLEAVHKLRAEKLPADLTIIGKMENDFKSWLSRSPLRSEINRHIEFVPNSELAPYFQEADVFCLSSVQEGLALVIAEAMACGLPVVATENTGGEEFIRTDESGFVVPPRSSDALAEALTKLAADTSLRLSMGEEAAKQSQMFSWDTYGERIIETYSRVLADKAQGKQSTGDEISDYYTEYWDKSKGWTPSHSFTQEQLDVHFKDAFKPGDSVLDVGCGDASNYQAWMVKHVAKLSAIDISPTGVARARAMGLDAHVHDFAQTFPFADNSYEGAVCIEVLEHLYDPLFCVKEVFRILKPGGLFVMSVPNNGYFRERLKAFTKAELSTSITDFANEWKGAHIRFYSEKSLTRMLSVAGFNIESVRSNKDASIFDGLDAFGGYMTQHVSTLLRKKLPRALRMAFLEDLWPSAFAPHLIVWARKPENSSR